MLHRVRKDILRYGMFNHGDRVVVAVSGGADSMALLFILHHLSEEFSLRLIVAHFHHGLRAEADGDEALVRRTAAALGWPYEVERGDVRVWREKCKRSLEDTARLLRYRFLDDTAEKYGAAKIALGHHRLDQAETVLIHLIRGSGLTGLKGMAPVREGKYIRPLLFCDPQEIRSFLAQEGLTFRTDSSNRDTRFLRNRIRHRLIPLLEGEFNPRIVDGLVQMAEILREEDSVLDSLVEVAMSPHEGGTAYRCDRLTTLPDAIRYRVIKRLLEEIRPAGKTVTAAHVAGADRLIRSSRPSAQIAVPGGMVRRNYGWVTVEKGNRVSLRPGEFCSHLPLPGEVQIVSTGQAVRATMCDMGPVTMREIAPNILYLPVEVLSGPLTVRSWRPGDRIQPLGMRGTKKVQDILGEAKVPRLLRHQVPIFADNQGILWIGGVKIAERCRLKHGAAKVVKIEIV